MDGPASAFSKVVPSIAVTSLARAAFFCHDAFLDWVSDF